MKAQIRGCCPDTGKSQGAMRIPWAGAVLWSVGFVVFSLNLEGSRLTRMLGLGDSQSAFAAGSHGGPGGRAGMSPTRLKEVKN